MERPPLSSSISIPRLAKALAEILVAGPWRREDLIERGALAFGHRWPWLDPLAGRLVAACGSGTRPTSARVAEFLVEDPGFLTACECDDVKLSGRRLGPVMWPAFDVPSGGSIPTLLSEDDLATWAGIAPYELGWFADLDGRTRRAPPGPLRHYDYRWIAKRNGSTRRLIESPRPRLKALQRRLLDEILAAIPPHEAAHGFRPGRSVRTYIAPHVGRRVVLKMDLRDFFPTIHAGRVVGLFLAAGYPEAVARLLAGLCTNGAPPDVWLDPAAPASLPDGWRLRQCYSRPHLPQGASTSPALANLAAFRLDARLSALAEASGASYTRYADDLAFSGDRPFERSAPRFLIHAMAIAMEEGFAVHARKTRIMRRCDRQRVAGIVVNERPNVGRREYDTLKAIVSNCVRHGPDGQNRDGHDDFRAHLAGRISYVSSIHPGRGRRLREQFDRIAW